MKIKNIVILLLLSAVCAVGWFLVPTGGDRADEREQRADSLVSRKISRAKSSKADRRAQRIAGTEGGVRREAPAAKEWNPFGAEKPSFDFDEEREAELSDEVKAIITELNDAFRRPDTDKKAVCQAVQKLIDLMYGSSVASGRGGGVRRGRGGALIASGAGGASGSGSVPTFVKERALEALKWVGADAMPETVALVADDSPQISEMAKEALLEQMMDFDAREADIVAAIKQLVQVDMDPGQYESMMFTVSSFKNSNKVDVALTVYDKGTEQAFESLSRNVDFIFDQSEYEGIKTREDIVNYGKMHPDGQDDFDFDLLK